MTEYTLDELADAHSAIESTVKKIEKVRGKETLGPSQKTLIERRLRALKIALKLIEAKMEEGDK